MRPRKATKAVPGSSAGDDLWHVDQVGDRIDMQATQKALSEQAPDRRDVRTPDEPGGLSPSLFRVREAVILRCLVRRPRNAAVLIAAIVPPRAVAIGRAR